MKEQPAIDFDKARASKAKAAEAIRNQDLPPYIAIAEAGDTDIGQLYHPVNLDDLMGEGIPGTVQRPYTVSEILHALAVSDRAEVKKAIKKGYSPVLFVDLLSGAVAIEMRKYTQPFPQIPKKNIVRKIPVIGYTQA